MQAVQIMERTIATREEQVVEAVKRMKMLQIMPQTIKEFMKEGVVNQSESGILYWVSDEELKAEIKAFEEEYNTLVYHVIRNRVEGCDWWTCLYVSRNMDEWEEDVADLAESVPYAYVIGWEKEIGRVGVRPLFGGVARTQ